MAEIYVRIANSMMGFAGSGGYLILFFGCVLFNFFTEKERRLRLLFVWLPIAVTILFFCPFMGVIFAKDEDGDVMYRILWLLPMAPAIAYTLVKVILLLPKKWKYPGVLAGFVLIMLFGSYIYANPYFSKAENIYHVPETVVKICDELKVEGREVKACVPEELAPFVRQYSPLIHLSFGRGVYMFGDGLAGKGADILEILRKDRIDTEALSKKLRESGTHYLVVRDDSVFTENPWNYDYCFVTNIDGYDVYLDNNAYLGLDFVNYR